MKNAKFCETLLCVTFFGEKHIVVRTDPGMRPALSYSLFKGFLENVFLFQMNGLISRNSIKPRKKTNHGHMSLSLGMKKIVVREDLDMRLALSCSFFKGLSGKRSPVPNEHMDFEKLGARGKPSTVFTARGDP